MKDCTKTKGWIEGLKASQYTQKQNRLARIDVYNDNPNKCEYCGKPIPYHKKGNKYCNRQCSAFCQPKGIPRSKETKEKIRKSALKYAEKTYDSYKYTKIYYHNCVICNKLWVSKYKIDKKSCSHKCYCIIISNIAKKNSKLRGNKNRHARWYISPIAGKVWLESSWEQLLAEDLDKYKIKWCRPRDPFKWVDPLGKERRYYPDFYLNDYDLYIDPKNPYLAKKDKYKIDYVKNKYKINLLIISEVEKLTYEFIKISR